MIDDTSNVNMDTKTTWQPNWAARLTIADALFALVALAAGLLRLVNLGSLPLSPSEAEAALAVWRFWQPGHTAVFPGSPAYFTLTALATQVLGFSDAVMRLVPALFGVALVLLPWLLRQRMGPVGALITAVFLAVSPITTITARTAGGEAIALFAIFLLLAAWVRWQDSRDGRWAITLAAALGLGIASAPLFYSGLAALGIAWFWQTTIGPRLNQPEETGEVDETAAETETEKETAVGPAAALTGLIVFLMLTTTFLFNLSGIGGGTAVFTAWVQQFGRSDLEPVIKPFLAIARYDLTLIIVGFAAFVWASWNRQALPRLFVYWLLGGFAIILLQQGIISNAALAPLAGYLLLGCFATAIIGDKIHLRGWGLTIGLLIVWGLMFVNISRFLRISVFNPTDFSHIWIALFGLTLALTTIYFLITWDVRSTYQGVLLSVLAMLFLYQWGTASWLGQMAANDPRETWVTTGTDDDVGSLIRQIELLSWQIVGSGTDIDLYSAVNSPVLAWYLRDFPQAQIGDSLPPAATFSLILTPDVAEPALGSDYMGADFGLLHTGVVSSGLSVSPILDTLRWWLFQESTAVSQQQRLVLWLRADLTQ